VRELYDVGHLLRTDVLEEIHKQQLRPFMLADLSMNRTMRLTATATDTTMIAPATGWLGILFAICSKTDYSYEVVKKTQERGNGCQYIKIKITRRESGCEAVDASRRISKRRQPTPLSQALQGWQGLANKGL
jgi:hypothetical protein